MGESAGSNGNHRPHRLRTALLDMEEQVKGMLKLMEQESDSIGDGAEVHYRRRPELTILFEELRRSYCSLSNHFEEPSSSSTSISGAIQHHKDKVQTHESNLGPRDYNSQSVTGDPDDENSADSFDSINEFTEDFMPINLKFQFKKLVAENLQQQEELVRRNNNKREVIKELRFQLHHLVDENRALHRCIGGSKGNVNNKQSRISKWKGIILDKLQCRGF